MTTQTEALKLALEALELHGNQYPHMVKGYCLDAITAIKEALAQPERKPWVSLSNEEVDDAACYCVKSGQSVNAAIRAIEAKLRELNEAPQRKPLTDEMVLAGARALAKRHADSCGLDFDDVWKYYSDEHKDDAKVVIEAAHGIKE